MSNPVSKLKDHHRRAAFALLLQRRELTRLDIAHALGISVQTAIKIMKYFEDYGLVRCVGEGSSALGRKPQIYALVPESACLLGVVHEGSVIHAGVVNLAFELLVEQSVDMRGSIQEVIVQQTCEMAQGLLRQLAQRGYPVPQMIGLGLGLPGVIDDQRSEVSFAPSLSIRTAYSIAPMLQQLQQSLGLPVVIENDVNAAVYGEYGGTGDLAFLSIGSGVGMGLMLDGRLRRGSRCMAGEIAGVRLAGGQRAVEEIIGLDALKKIWGFERRFGLAAMPPEVRDRMLDSIAETAALLLAATAAILDVTSFVVGGLTLDLMGAALFDRIEQQTRRLVTLPVRVVRQTMPCPALVGVCKKMMNLRLDDLLSLDRGVELCHTEQ